MTNVARQVETTRESGADALEDAFARYQGELLGTLYYLVGNMEDAHDALQEAFIKCWRHQDQVPEVKNLKAWIFRVVMNTGRDIRQTAWSRKRQSLPEDESILESRSRGPESMALENEQIELLRGAIKTLRHEEQEVFLLRQNAQLKYEEIAATVGIPVGTVKTRMRLALTRLRKALA